jgi:SpoIID/LytB domain protein
VLVALTPANQPTRGLVVVAPGAAGLDAATVAADLLGPDPSPTHDNARGETTTRDVAPGQTPAGGAVTLRIGIASSNGRTRVQNLTLEDYVARVVAGEGQPRARDAAQQALAIAVRTFALANRNRHRREGFDLCDSTHCQVLRAATATTSRAAEETAGRVLVHQSTPATVFYSAWCGGRMERASDVWPGASDYVSAAAQEDDACRDEQGWTSEIDARDLERALRLAGLRGDRLRSLRIVSRSRSGRVARLSAEGFTPAEISGDDFRLAVGRVTGWQNVKSTMFDMRRISNGYVFTGRGFGHGVGMCVVGAGVRAARGESSDAILRFYYPGLRVQPYMPAALTTSATETLPPPEAIVPAADVLVALPAGEESERSAVLQLVRKARDEIAATTGVRPPAAIRVTVHPNVESFGRASGQPWWVSGATERSAIELLPLTVLQQRGQFERTIRHEVAHVLLDGALNGKPMWVREGAALYFANPTRAGERTNRVRCPDDAELLRPISAGAHRDAYARAESCFRRQILDGKPWRDVR